MRAKIYILKDGRSYDVLTSSGLLYYVYETGGRYVWQVVGRVGAGWVGAGRLLRSVPPVLKKDFFTYNKKTI